MLLLAGNGHGLLQRNVRLAHADHAALQGLPLQFHHVPGLNVDGGGRAARLMENGFPSGSAGNEDRRPGETAEENVGGRATSGYGTKSNDGNEVVLIQIRLSCITTEYIISQSCF